ncbi:MAG: TadE/TadG family type IV pilus assembly protein [Pseudomonadota bacterium]
MNNGKIQHGGRQRGLAAVEFAIILPLMLLLILATAELGRAFYLSNTLAKSVRDGARYVADNAIEGTTGQIDLDGTLVSETRNIVLYGSIGGGTPLLQDFAPGDIAVTQVDVIHVQVSASYNFTPIFNRIPTFGLGAGDIELNFPLQATVTMRAL